MESAIPPHLQVTRTRHRRVPDDYDPPYPAFVARHDAAVKQVVMAYFGAQHQGAAPPAFAAALGWIAERFAASNGPRHWDRATYVDEVGYSTTVSVAYWDDKEAFNGWFADARNGWTGGKVEFSGIGTFIEVLSPGVDRYETLFSSLGRPEGVAVLADSLSADVMEHAYWGGMRDRIPASQTSALSPSGAPSIVGEDASVRVMPTENICLIRSGQDWSDTDAAERQMYLEDVEPVLRAGMDFLRDDGIAIGCFANRYMTVIDRDGKPTEKSYGMSWWKSLAALERWSESHPTHVRIFGAAMQYLSQLGPAAKLRLYHEVTVAGAADQFFEYRNCHNKTGMLRAAP